MKRCLQIGLLLCVVLTNSFLGYAQQAVGNKHKGVKLSGSVQADMLLPQEDKEVGTDAVAQRLLSNTYIDLNLQHQWIDAAVRLEYMQHPMPGFEKNFAGRGIPFYYIKGKFKQAALTLGAFYEQFGAGFVLRTYEERSLGVDNSLMGAHLLYKPFKGVILKALSGRQRTYWQLSKSWVSGVDAEWDIAEYSKALQQSNTHITLGASWVNKYQFDNTDAIMVDRTHCLNLPSFVNAWDVRAQIQSGAVSILAEYAQKTHDPSFANQYIYRKGRVAMLSASYSKPGISVLLQAKRSDDMVFKSNIKQATGPSAYINHLPAFTQDHTYALPALYPYATQPDGEWAYQAQIAYLLKRNTLLGGRYGTKLKLNFSYVRGIDKTENKQGAINLQDIRGSKGYGSKFFAWNNQVYYQDFNIMLQRKCTKNFKLNLMYMNQIYNQTVVEGKGGNVYANIFVADGKYKFSNKLNVRGELQYLTTKQAQGDWLYALVDVAIVPNWMITLSDMYNVGVTKLHYYQSYITFNKGAHRIQMGYGRTRAGYNCAGGVCRYIPATKGLTLSYHYNF